MKLPPWLAGLLIVLVLVALWWALSGDGSGESQSAGASPTASARAEQPTSGIDDPQDPEDPEDPQGESGEDAGRDDPSGAGPGDEGSGDEGPVGVDTRSWDDIEACRDDVLPRELEPVTEDIAAGGPYDHPDKDGSTFGNYEGYLPQESRGYYREFTVETPGLSHRGAKRVVTGGPSETSPEVWYYSDDHYESFCEFAP